MSSVTEEICGLADLVLRYLAALDAFYKSRLPADRDTLVKLKNQLDQVTREILRDYRGEQTSFFD